MTERKDYSVPGADLSEMRSSGGAHRTESLFNEVIQAVTRAKLKPIYSLRDYDYKGYPSAYQIYITSIDEREAALKLVGSLSHWRKLCKLRWFMNGKPECQFEGLAQWREDMAARDATEAKRVIIEQCRENNVPAARALNQMADKVPKSVTKPKLQKSSADSNITDFLSKHKK